MITALDSSVLWAIVNREPGHESWLQVLFQAATEGPLIISPVAFAELAPSTRDEAELTAFLDRLAIAYSPISPAAAHLAGLTFNRSATGSKSDRTIKGYCLLDTKREENGQTQ